jgi:signal transduction histidine kinase
MLRLAMQHLAAFLRDHGQGIVESWLAEVVSLPSATRRSRALLRDDMPALVQQIADALEANATIATAEAVNSVATAHARGRFEQGYDIRDMVIEYSIFRRTIIEHYAAHAGGLDEDARGHVRAIAYLNVMLDAAIADAIAGFMFERDRARDVFIGILGHDLRAPLQSFVMGTEMLMAGDTVEPDAVGKIVPRMARSARRMAGMIRDLLDFTRAHMGGGIPIETSPFDLEDLIEEVIEEQTAAHPQRDIQWRGTAGLADLRGTWDRERIAQALVNLITNAIEHGRDPIVLEAVHAGGTVRIDVSSNGRLPADLIGPIRKPFTRPSTVGTKGRSGLGLGLYIVAEIARAHGGAATAEMVDVDRCRFSISLPDRRPDQAPGPG